MLFGSSINGAPNSLIVDEIYPVDHIPETCVMIRFRCFLLPGGNSMFRLAAALIGFLFMLQTPYDVVITGGRVLDPETGLDGIRNLGISAGKIASVSTAFSRAFPPSVPTESI